MSNAKNTTKNQQRPAEPDTIVERVRGTVATTEGPPGEGEQIGGGDAITEPVIRAPSMDDVAAMRAQIAALEQERDIYKGRLDRLSDTIATSAAPLRSIRESDATFSNPGDFIEGPQRALRPSIDVLLRDLPPGYTPRELEQLATGILKKAGHAGKTPTGKHVARHAFMRDKIDETTGKTVRVAPGTVLDDLSPAEVAHLTKHKAIEPEYA